MKETLIKLKNNKIIQDWVIPIATAGVIFLILRTFVFINVEVPTPSMVPTVEIGDRMFTTHIYNYDKLKRGDIIAFKNEDVKIELNGKVVKNGSLLKRLIGLPNEEIRIEKDGTIYIDGVKIEENYVVNQVDESNLDPLMNIGTFKVPEGAYFFLGDNRSSSKDARYWEDPYVYEDELVSKVRFRFWPFSKFGKVE